MGNKCLAVRALHIATNKEYRYDSIKDASAATKANKACISQCIKGYRLSSKGYMSTSVDPQYERKSFGFVEVNVTKIVTGEKRHFDTIKDAATFLAKETTYGVQYSRDMLHKIKNKTAEPTWFCGFFVEF